METHSDEPTSDDQLGRRPFAQALVERMNDVRRKGGSDGFAVHLDGPWGVGKTSIVFMMREFMGDVNREPRDRWAVVYFNAWQHERRNPPWWPLIESIKAGCFASLWRNATGTKDYWGFRSRWRAIGLEDKWIVWKIVSDWFPFMLSGCVVLFSVFALYRFAWGNPSDSVSESLKTVLTIVTSITAVFGAFVLAGRSMVFGSAHNAKFYFDLSGDPLKRITGLFKRIVKTTKMPICIFVDDLDRCSAEYVVALLEGIQTSFRHQNVAYVVAADRNWIKASFEAKYDTFTEAVGEPGQPLGYLFLEKIFQISTPVPGMGDAIQNSYWRLLLTGTSSLARKRDESLSTSGEGLTEPLGTGTEDASGAEVLEAAKDAFDRKVEEERQSLRKDHTEGLTRTEANAILAKQKSPEVRAAVVLELNASRAAERESEHLLSKFASIVPDNPRVMKRMVNAFAMRQAIGILEGSTTPPEVLARWTILEQRFPALADLLVKSPEWTRKISIAVKAAEVDKLPPSLRPFVNVAVIGQIVGKRGENRLTVEHVRTITRGSAA